LVDIRDKFGKKPLWFITSTTLPNAQLEMVLPPLRIEDAKETNENLDCPSPYYNVIASFIGDRFRGLRTRSCSRIRSWFHRPKDSKVEPEATYDSDIFQLDYNLAYRLRRLPRQAWNFLKLQQRSPKVSNYGRRYINSAADMDNRVSRCTGPVCTWECTSSSSTDEPAIVLLLFPSTNRKIPSSV